MTNMENALDVINKELYALNTNEPINRQNRNIKQADLELQTIKELNQVRQIIECVDRAKSIDKD